MPDLSIIIPYVREYPQILFTIRSIAEELVGRVDFEIIAVDNYCNQVKQQNYTCLHCGAQHPTFENDKTEEVLVASSGKINPWLKVVKYQDKLSHWQAKNFGVKHSTGDVLWFCDSHCSVGRNILYNMFEYFTTNELFGSCLNGTLHLPLSYKILESHRTIYKPVLNVDKGEYHYALTGYRDEVMPYEVPAASTCGMMITRKLFDELGGWPSEFGIYGGGENFINFSLAVMGKKKFMFTSKTALYHHGEHRGYHYVYDDYIKNRLLATYMFGGKKTVELFVQHAKGRPGVLRSILNNIYHTSGKHRQIIKSKQIMEIEDWTKKWK